MAKIIIVGSLNMDLVIKADRMPLPGETIPGHGFQTIPGGKGANQAVAAARLGSRVAMAGRVGDDDFGTALVENLGLQGVDASPVQVDGEAATGIALIIGSGIYVLRREAKVEARPIAYSGLTRR